MKIDLSKIDQKIFLVRPTQLNGEVIVLVEPHYSGGSEKWNLNNLHLRSSMWSVDGELISASHKKFFNLGESPLFPTPKNLKGSEIMEKKDGSALIISFYKNEFIIRTRGTFSYKTLTNANEIDFLREKYYDAFEYIKGFAVDGTSDFSLIFEFYSNTHKIVINYGDEPEMWLIAAIKHSDYSLLSQDELDVIAADMCVGRPKRFGFDSIEQMVEIVKAMEGQEGVCWYYGKNQQNILKIKADKYLHLHRLKSEVSSQEKVLDLWLNEGKPSYLDFYMTVATKLDFEIAEYCKGDISRICDAAKVMERMKAGFRNFVETRLRHIKSRREQAEIVFASYSDGNRASYVFKYLENKDLTKEHEKKLMMQILKAPKVG